MKSKLTFLTAVLALACTALFAEPGPTESVSNYVVIGAFSIEENAIHFAELAKKQHLNAAIEMNTSRHLFYVYVMHTGDRSIAIEEAKKLRVKTAYNDTWVYSGLLGKEIANHMDIDPTSGSPKTVIETEQPADAAPSFVNENESPQKENKEDAIATTSAGDLDGGKNFFFKIVRASNGNVLNGDVDVFDVDKNKKAKSLAGNKDVLLTPVNSASGKMSLQCQVFGYRKMAYVLNFSEPEATEGVTSENGRVTVPFEMVRLKKGDYSVMYNVMFYKDAAIMRPESKYEVDELLAMMKENPKYKIRIHGHTNGKASGKILSMGETKNFFSLTGAHEGFGSAKRLSEERALTIQDYLIAEGITADRLEVKAWGGKKPIYEKTHAQAHNNVRVEIEIVEE